MFIGNLINEDTVNNIYNTGTNQVLVYSNKNVLTDSKKCFGKLIGLVNVKENTKKLLLNDIVEFYPNKIIWQTVEMNPDGCRIVLVKYHFTKKMVYDKKVKVRVKVLKSKLENGIRTYFSEYEQLEMTQDQFIKNKLLEKFGHFKHVFFEAKENMEKRLRLHKDYYRALNETCKTYRIEHKDLVDFRSMINNGIKEIYQEWKQLVQQNYTAQDLSNVIDHYYGIYKQSVESQKKDNVVVFKKA